jgi:4-hydroxy-tetrahydrodipicolinate synthase
MVKAGVHGLFLFGSTGLYAFFDAGERREWIEAAVAVAAGRVPVLVGVQAAATHHVEKLARQVEAAGADALVLLPPHPQPVRRHQDLVAYFHAAAHSTSLPLVIYHNPSVGHAKLDEQTVAEIVDGGNVIAIKDTSYDFQFFRNLVRRFADRQGFSVLQGAIPYADVSLYVGADGVVPGTGSLAPGLWVALYDAAKGGQWDEARRIQEKLIALNGIYGPGGRDWPSGLHFALSCLGLCQHRVPRPYAPLPSEDQKRVKAVLAATGLLEARADG